jgi:Ca2+-binding RTX toxin-like protein
MGAGNDTVTVGAATNLTAVDSIVGGAGKDTIVVTDVTLNATIQTAIAEATGFEVLATSATAEKTVDFSALTLFEEVAITAAGSATAATTGTNAAAGTDAIGVTSDNTGNTLSITEGQTGQAGSVSAATVAGKAGGDSLQIAASSDGASDSFTINLTGNADITGGAGGGLTDQTHDATGGAGGMAINAASLEALTIHVISNEVTADTVTIDGGAGGAQVSTNADTGDTVGADGVAITLSANATLTLTDDVTTSAKDYNDVTIGTVKGTNVVVDGSALRGDLTVSAIDGNVTVSGGAGADTLTGGTGADTIRGNAGDDTITGAGGKDTLYGGAGSDTFDIVTGNASSAVTAVTDIIMDFANGLSGDTINLEFDGAVIGDKASTDVSGAVSGTTDLNAVTADGIITLSGTGVSLVDTAAEVIDIFELMDATNTEEFGAVVVGDDTYVIGINSSNAVLEVVLLDGMNDATSISLVDAAGGILIA